MTYVHTKINSAHFQSCIEPSRSQKFVSSEEFRIVGEADMMDHGCYDTFVTVQMNYVCITTSEYVTNMLCKIKILHFMSSVQMNYTNKYTRSRCVLKNKVYFPNSAGWTPNKQFCFSKSAPFRILSPHSKLWYHICSQAKWSSNCGLGAVVSE